MKKGFLSLSLTEAVIVTVIIFMLAAIFIPAFYRARKRAIYERDIRRGKIVRPVEPLDFKPLFSNEEFTIYRLVDPENGCRPVYFMNEKNSKGRAITY